MIFDHPKKTSLLSSRDRLSTTDEPSSYTGRVSDAFMPGSDILEGIDTPLPFRKRTLQMTQEDKQRKLSNVSPNPSSMQVVNGKLDCEYY